MALRFKKLSGGSGGGGSATVTKQGWLGTQVPNSGIVENIYFNTSLTKEEVHNILSGLNFANVGAPNGILIYMPFVNADYSCNIEIDYYPTTNEYTLSYAVDGVALRIFDSTNPNLENGWNTNYFIEAYNVNSENTASSIMAQFGVEMQNDKLTQLISTTPFTQETETVTLSGDYDGATYQATENTIDIKALLEEKKLPLEINVSIPSNYFRMEKFTLPMVDINRSGEKFPYLTTYYGTPLEKVANLMTGGQGYDTLYAHEYAYFRPNGKIYMNDGSGEYGFHCCLEVKSYYTRGMMFELTFDFGDLPVSEYGIKRFLMAYIEINGETNEMFIGGLDFMGKDNYDDSYTQYTDDTIIETFKAFITKFEIWLPQV